ncbi:glycosyltransferase family 2 protein [Geodermatophilus obscurus]|uniref:Glycosyl transferase family 2 n=1 Tax=Geodermatophilus obscurus (strain ATCC 25078 / DSM 43160 / JCM 3152 / CCUG 61914 / KCC A-0152 / KCTC 9177 / NBRC 13315 / NRRL B-3577 / G-20) TaxID=526225 RepID=D2S572_GEOOG|nr:glycosyltransferase [Geodermatophilus obscurus]ADB73183.1 glycosyl transferase family 2 [Geodermatophilus obscurus DSM 43160]
MAGPAPLHRPIMRSLPNRLWQPLVTHALHSRAAWLLGWRLLVPLLRRRARMRLGRLTPGAVTVITVNWNGLPYLRVLLDVVRRRSPDSVRIVVVDNGSTDGSRDFLRARRDVEPVLLPANLGHDLALDLAVLTCQTEFFITLDVDAFPLTTGWIEKLLAPLVGGTAEISGARLWRPYVHPCCLAMRTARFVRAGHTFRSRYQPGTDTEPARGDVGEEMSAREAPRLHFFEVTSQRGPGDVGTVFGDLVYHNFYGTRFGAGHTTLDGGIQPDDPRRAWAEAVQRYVR